MKLLRNRLIILVVVFLFIWYLARLPAWSAHLQIDVWVFWQRIEYWHSHLKSFAGMSGNEILPATLLYLFVPVFLIPIGWLSYTTYLPAVLLLNLAVLGATWAVTKDKQLYLAGLLSLGPILLFRFDAMVTLLLIIGLTLFVKQKYVLSGLAMGLAVGMKVFPVILVPYLMLILGRGRKFKDILDFGASMILAGVVPIILYLYLGGNLEQIKQALAFHSNKLISIESIPGSLITAAELLTAKAPPPLLPGNGIWSVPGPVALFNRFWLGPILGLYWVIWKYPNLWKKLRWEVPLCLILVFLISSKNLNPQYIWWYMVLLPFVSRNKIVVGLMVAVAILNQLVYPLFYTTLIDNFYRENRDYWVYYLLLLRNLGIVAIAIIQLKGLIGLGREGKEG